MKKAYFLSFVLLCGVMLLERTAMAWDVIYDGSVMPNDPALGPCQWGTYMSDLSNCSSDGNDLHVSDQRTDAYAVFSRFAAPKDSPLTVEARVRVPNGDGTVLYAGTPTFYTLALLYSDRISVSFAPSPYATYTADLSLFRTIRIATDSQGQSYVWLDGDLLAQGLTSMGNQGDVLFGSISAAGVNESYWDYVAYSNDFLPVPEPASLLALAGGLAGVAIGAMRRRRHVLQ